MSRYQLRSQYSKYPCSQLLLVVSLPQNVPSQEEEEIIHFHNLNNTLTKENAQLNEEIIHFQNLNNTLTKENEQLNEEINRKDIDLHKFKQERNNLRNETIYLRQQILDLRIQIINLQKDINFVRNVNFCLGGFFMSCMGYYLYQRIPFRMF